MKAYHIAFVFKNPTPATITLPAESAEAAETKLREMVRQNYGEIDIFQTVDLDEVDAMRERAQAMIEAMDADTTEAAAISEAEIAAEETKTIN